MEHELKSHMIKCAEVFAEAHGLSVATVARRAIGNSEFFSKIVSGSFTVRIYDRTMEWFGRNWPANLAWPDGVPRVSFPVSEAAQ